MWRFRQYVALSNPPRPSAEELRSRLNLSSKGARDLYGSPVNRRSFRPRRHVCRGLQAVEQHLNPAWTTLARRTYAGPRWLLVPAPTLGSRGSSDMSRD